MGNGGSFSAASRWEARWLSASSGALVLPSDLHAATSGNPSAVDMRALSHSLTSGYGQHSAIAMDCPKCMTIGSDGDDGNWLTTESVIGGTLLVSYRGPVGLDGSQLSSHELSRVQVQLLKYENGPAQGRGSDLFAALAQGESYYVRFNGLAGAFCHTHHSNSECAGLSEARRNSESRRSL